MKNFYLLLVGLLFASLLSAQTYLNEDFSSGTVPPEGWFALPSSAWLSSSTSNAGGIAPECRFQGFTANSTARLISSGVDLSTTDTAILIFKHKYIRTGAGLTIGVAYQDGVTWVPVWEETPNQSMGPEEVIIMLTGDQINTSNFKLSFYLTGQLGSCQDWYIDDIVLFAPIAFDAKMSSILTPDIITEPSPVIGSIMNLGTTVVQEANVSWVSYAGIVRDSTFTGLNLGLLEVVDLTFDGSWVSPPGAYNLEMYINSVNGEMDMDQSNDTLTKQISYQSVSFENKPVFEEFTSSTCAPCAGFNASFIPWTVQHADEITLVKYQMSWPGAGDPYYTAEGGTRRTYYGVNSVPDLMAQGVDIGPSVSAANSALLAAQDETSLYSIASTFEITGTNIDIETNILPFTTASATVHNIIIEKVTTGNVATNGETEFHHVMMKMMPNANGSLESFTSGQTKQITYSYDLSTTHVEEYDDLMVVVILQNSSTKEVYQSGYGPENANYSNEARLSSMTLNGELLDGFDPDIYEYDVKLPVGTVEEPVLNGVPMNDNALMIVNMAFAIPGTASIKVFAENLITQKTYSVNYTYDNVGVEEPVKDLISVYPNPAKDKLYFVGLQNSDVSIMTSTGKIVIQRNNFSGSEVDISNLSQGVYIVMIRTNNGEYVHKKIMVL